MARYRKVDPRMWGDAKFQTLSQPRPSGQFLWIYLLTGPHTTIIPGLFCSGKLMLAEALGWSPSQIEACVGEIESQKMMRADWSARVVWLPKALSYNPPESPNAAMSWRSAIEDLPECQLRDDAFAEIEAFLHELGDDFLAAWTNGARSVVRKKSPAVKVPKDMAAAVKARDGDICKHCGKKVNWKDRRGPDGATYDNMDAEGRLAIDTVVIACRSCNQKRTQNKPRSEPRSDLGSSRNNQVSDSGKNLGSPGNQEQEQEQEQEQDLVNTRNLELEFGENPDSPDQSGDKAPESQKPQTGEDVDVPAELNTPAFKAAWSLWQQHRAEKRNKLTPTAARQQLKKLAEWGAVRATAALEFSMASGYTGVFELGGASGGNGSQNSWSGNGPGVGTPARRELGQQERDAIKAKTNRVGGAPVGQGAAG